MKHEVSNLSGALLDAAVALAEGYRRDVHDPTAWWRPADGHLVCISVPGAASGYGFRPSSDWAEGGPILERERIELHYYNDGDGSDPWEAHSREHDHHMPGPTPLIAAMRGFVSSRLGAEVDL